LLGFTIGNPKYLGGSRGPGGFEPLPPGFDGRLAKIVSTSLGISSCKIINFVPLGVCGLDLIPTTVWTNVDTNGTLVTVIIDEALP
jgi:hypothetical protein